MTPPSSTPDSSRPQQPSRRGRWLLLLVPLVLGLGGLLLGRFVVPGSGSAWSESEPAPSSSGTSPDPRQPVAAAPAAPSKGPRLEEPRAPAGLSPEEAEREAQRQLWEKRLERARFTLDSYRESTRYPPESRPIREQPDQVYPSSPEGTRPLSKDNPEVRLRMKQEKVFVAGDETVRFFVGCENARNGQPLACTVDSAFAHEAPHMMAAEQLSSVPLDFNDAGRNGDELAGDGTFTASFMPARQGFALFSGTLRIEFKVKAGNAQGAAFFDILFTAAPPAKFSGKVREVVEQGSLQLYLGLQVRKPGRYVIAGRVDDEAGVPFAYVAFNEELEAGTREVKLTVFGKLLHDENPDFPLKLRDVEGFLLLEGDPDRELLASLSGPIHTTREYPLERFSKDEWQSEERQRHLDEFTKDVNEAQKNLDKLPGKGTARPSPP